MPDLALYYSPGACSLAAHALLREWGVPFEARPVAFAKGEHLSPDYLSLNPHGRVPLLLIDGKPVSELSGILTWIGQQSGFYPDPGTYEAGKTGEWLGWLTSTVHIDFALIWRGERFAADKSVHAALRQKGYDLVGEHFAEIEAALQRNRFAVGGARTVADYNLLPFYRWGNRIGLNMAAHYPAWSAHADSLSERAAVRETLAAEGISIHDAQPLPEGVIAPAPPRL